MHLYKDSYESIHYLKLQSDSFIGWICPLLKQVFIPIEQYIYYETDQITEIYFLTKGNAGFVLPFKQNIVYIEIEKGDHFGEIDFVVASGSKMLSVEEMVELINTVNFNLIR
jgi:CRP-like cAMP-binding protein